MCSCEVRTMLHFAEERHVAETLDTLATKLNALSVSVDSRFEQVDSRFEQVDKRLEQIDKRFDQVDAHIKEVKTHLQVLIEAVDTKVDRLLEGFETLVRYSTENVLVHQHLNARLDNHELRIQALESDRARPR
jgi:chaperonin cofactor prefoldin